MFIGNLKNKKILLITNYTGHESLTKTLTDLCFCESTLSLDDAKKLNLVEFDYLICDFMASTEGIQSFIEFINNNKSIKTDFIVNIRSIKEKEEETVSLGGIPEVKSRVDQQEVESFMEKIMQNFGDELEDIGSSRAFNFSLSSKNSFDTDHVTILKIEEKYIDFGSHSELDLESIDKVYIYVDEKKENEHELDGKVEKLPKDIDDEFKLYCFRLVFAEQTQLELNEIILSVKEKEGLCSNLIEKANDILDF